jgi:predicted ArsR family transcriptional regulator
MSRQTCNAAPWADEVKRLGIREAIRQRLTFHVGLNMDDLTEGTGRGSQTIRKHMRVLVEEGFCKEDYPNHWRKII